MEDHNHSNFHEPPPGLGPATPPGAPPSTQPSQPAGTFSEPCRRPQNALDEDEINENTQELISRTPNWLVRTGNTWLALFLLILLWAAYYINYPDVIKAPITIVGSRPVVPLIARRDGHIEINQIKNGDTVSQGQILAVIKSPSDPESVAQAKKLAEMLRGFLTSRENFVELELPIIPHLGSLQGQYTQLQTTYTNYRDILQDDFSEKSVKHIKAQMALQQEMVNRNNEQITIYNEELSIAQESIARLETLRRNGVLSPGIFRKEQEAFLSKQRLATNIASELSNSNIAISTYQQRIDTLQHDRREQLRQVTFQLQEALKTLYSSIDVWEGEYILRAESDGVVSFFDYWSDNQFVKAGTEVFVLLPKIQDSQGRIAIKGVGAGKVEVGQRVKVELTDFPSKEFGIIWSEIEAVSLAPRGGTHLATISFEGTITTHLKKTIPFKQEMQGDATIITKKRSILGRIFEQFTNAFESNKA